MTRVLANQDDLAREQDHRHPLEVAPVRPAWRVLQHDAVRSATPEYGRQRRVGRVTQRLLFFDDDDVGALALEHLDDLRLQLPLDQSGLTRADHHGVDAALPKRPGHDGCGRALADSAVRSENRDARTGDLIDPAIEGIQIFPRGWSEGVEARLLTIDIRRARVCARWLQRLRRH